MVICGDATSQFVDKTSWYIMSVIVNSTCAWYQFGVPLQLQ